MRRVQRRRVASSSLSLLPPIVYDTKAPFIPPPQRLMPQTHPRRVPQRVRRVQRKVVSVFQNCLLLRLSVSSAEALSSRPPKESLNYRSLPVLQSYLLLLSFRLNLLLSSLLNLLFLPSPMLPVLPFGLSTEDLLLPTWILHPPPPLRTLILLPQWLLTIPASSVFKSGLSGEVIIVLNL